MAPPRGPFVICLVLGCRFQVASSLTGWLIRPMSRTFILRSFVLALALMASTPGRSFPLSPDRQNSLSKAHRSERAGWIYLHIQGEPRDLGFQHGYLLAPEISDALRTVRANWEHDSAMPWPWLVRRATMFIPRLDPENLAELDGIVEGMAAAGHPTSREEMVAYNGFIELAWYWWPIEFKTVKDNAAPAVRQSCSSFIATGSMTRDGNIVLGHNTMMDYNDVFPNVIADIAPAHGHRILWQTNPGWIHSGTDFFITDAGLVGSETTIGNFEGFDTNGVPEFARMRRATQDAKTIDDWCAMMRAGNNGGYANAWLLGDINTHEIARLELGLKFVGYEKKRDGYFSGSNVAEDPKLLRFETSEKETDIRESSVARRVRWKQIMRKYAGRIDVRLAKEFEADHFDTFRNEMVPGSRTLCGHYELDRDTAGSWPGVPYGCGGTVDAKVVDATLARRLSFAARWGSGCGRAFEATNYLAAHPQFDWMTDILKSRPAEPWVEFRAGE